MSWKKALGFGLVTWIVPFVVAIPFYGSDGTLRIDIHLFKSMMIVVSTLVGCWLIVKYFKGVSKNYVSVGMKLGWLWFGMNIVLDVIVLLPLAHLSVPEYVAQIGLRYLMIPMIAIACGYVAQHRKV